jgi:hypothetical protein
VTPEQANKKYDGRERGMEQELPLSIDDLVCDALTRVDVALAAPELVAACARASSAPFSAEDWFRLLAELCWNPSSAPTIQKLEAALTLEGDAAASAMMGRYAALKALSVALTKIADQRLPDAVKRSYVAFSRQIAARERHWEWLYNFDNNSETFRELAAYVTLFGFPVGDVGFGFDLRSPVRSILFVHPLTLPRFLLEVGLFMTGGPVLVPHMNYARKSLILPRIEYQRSLWLMARTLELRPEVKGLMAISWVHSAVVGQVFPSLAWMRDVFVEAGACVVELQPAKPRRYGFNYNNPKRLKLYEEGKFFPRQSIVLWPRDALIAWAANHPELAAEGEMITSARRGVHSRFNLKSPRPPRHVKHNFSIQLWDGEKAYKSLGRVRYVTLVLLLPALALALVSLAFSGVWLAIFTFALGLFVAHAFQYYFTQ